jgi:transcriptional regulator with GAF, ATPase, and Fis domain
MTASEIAAKSRMFIVLTCAVIPNDPMESGNFGHVKGAFTAGSTDHRVAAVESDVLVVGR